jgi:hypothetical protein
LFSRLALLLFMPLSALAVADRSATAPSQSPELPRTLAIAGVHGQPGYTLRISASGNLGRIEVDDTSGSPRQTLSCSLVRNEIRPAAVELAAIDQRFVADFATEDLDFDGYPDLKAPREFGSKWVRYCVWLFDSKDRLFVNGVLAEQMELLYNLETDAKHERVIASSIGPVNPLRDEYRIERTSKERPYWPRLIPVESCFIETASPPFLQVLTKYNQGQPAVKRQPFDLRAVCSSACDCTQPAGQR